MCEIEASLIICHAPKLSQTKMRVLVDHFGCATDALHAICSKSPLPFQLSSETEYYFLTLEKQKAWKEDLKEAEKQNCTLFPYTSIEYPQKFKSLSDCPLILYVKGKLPSETSKAVGIIGTRTATLQANGLAERFASHLAQAEVVIVSGLARGIDTHAHKGALQTGTTVAIIGSGISELYPKENGPLATSICLQGGAILSEQPMKTPPSRFNFPKRNRLISALSDCLLLVEAPKKSGAMLTMEIGQKQKKPLFALPGGALTTTSEGNQMLIKAQIAKLIYHPDEILHHLQLSMKITEHPLKRLDYPLNLPTEEEKIYALLKEQELSLEELQEAILLPIQTLQVKLSKLILQKIILELPGKRYKLFHFKPG